MSLHHSKLACHMENYISFWVPLHQPASTREAAMHFVHLAFGLQVGEAWTQGSLRSGHQPAQRFASLLGLSTSHFWRI